MPFGYCEVTLNHWPYNQICIGCKFDRLVSPKDDENSEEFYGRGSICLKGFPADGCVRAEIEETEKGVEHDRNNGAG